MKVICAGLNKTGTTSLKKALEKLNFRHINKDPYCFNAQVEKALKENKKILHYFEDYDSFSDIFLPADIKKIKIMNYKNRDKFVQRVEKDYPKTKFILTTCRFQDWIKSREKHILRNQKNQEYRGDWKVVDKKAWKEEWHFHHRKIINYFKRRLHNLLIINIREGDGWEKLCPFLGMPIPNIPFPHENKSPRLSSSHA